MGGQCRDVMRRDPEVVPVIGRLVLRVTVQSVGERREIEERTAFLLRATGALRSTFAAQHPRGVAKGGGSGAHAIAASGLPGRTRQGDVHGAASYTAFRQARIEVVIVTPRRAITRTAVSKKRARS